MALSLPEQAKKLIENSQRILLIAHAKMDGDTLSAAIAMHLLLQKMGKDTLVACADPVPEEYAFLPNTNVVQQEVNSEKDFVISVDCSRVKARRLRWRVEGNTLKIFISPSHEGHFSRNDVSFCENGDFDLIISLDAADKKQLGRIFEDNTELFARVPLIVFDHHASNPGFGTVNIINPKAASTTEVLFDFLPVLFGKNWKKRLTPDIATLLLTGIITDTGSFQNANTTPKSLEVSADLVELGARQQEIIRNIFKTKNISTLKLWGRVLSKIKTDAIHRMLWSTVSADDLIDTGGNIEDTNGIIDELLATAPGMEMVILIKERPDGMITVSVRTTTALCDAAAFAAEFGGGGHTQAAGFKIRGNKPFEVVVGEVIAAAQEFQNQRLGLFPAEEKISLSSKEKKSAPEKTKKNATSKKRKKSSSSRQEEKKEEPLSPPKQKKASSQQQKHGDEKKSTPHTIKREDAKKEESRKTKNVPSHKVEKQVETQKKKDKKNTADTKNDTDVTHQFSEILEKMMNLNPVEVAKNAPPPKK